MLFALLPWPSARAWAAGSPAGSPASIEPAADADGNPVSGGISEIRAVRLGGHDKTITIRGHNASNPVLLYPAGPYEVPAGYRERLDAAGYGPLGILAPEYCLIEKANVLRGLLDTFSIIYPQLQGIDFRRDATRLDVPVYPLVGDHELAARSGLANEWLGLLDAPKNRPYVLENTGHATAFEGVDEFTRIMNGVVLPETYAG